MRSRNSSRPGARSRLVRRRRRHVARLVPSRRDPLRPSCRSCRIPPAPASSCPRHAPPRHRRGARAAAARARLLGRAGQVAEDRRDALRAERRQADDAGVEHEDRDAGRRRREARAGTTATRRRSPPPDAIDDGVLQGDLDRRRLRRSEPGRRRRHGRSRVRRLGDTTEAARHPRDHAAASSATTTASRSRHSAWAGCGTTSPTEDSTSVGALQYNENALRVTVSPGPAAGDSAGRQPLGRRAAA